MARRFRRQSRRTHRCYHLPHRRHSGRLRGIPKLVRVTIIHERSSRKPLVRRQHGLKVPSLPAPPDSTASSLFLPESVAVVRVIALRVTPPVRRRASPSGLAFARGGGGGGISTSNAGALAPLAPLFPRRCAASRSRAVSRGARLRLRVGEKRDEQWGGGGRAVAGVEDEWRGRQFVHPRATQSSVFPLPPRHHFRQKMMYMQLQQRQTKTDAMRNKQTNSKNKAKHRK